MKKSLLARWRANFFAGLAVVMPGIISVGALVWIFGTVATFTDTLLFFLSHDVTHQDHGTGKMNVYAIVQAASAKDKNETFLFLLDYYGYKRCADGSIVKAS